MGLLAVIELANQVEAGTMTLIDAMRRHFSANFVKPIHEKWLPVCINIVERFKGGDHDLAYDILIPDKPDDLPIVAESLVEDLHLEPFMDG